MRKVFFILNFIILLIAMKVYAVDITTPTNWSSITPTPTSATTIIITSGTTLTVDVPNAVCGTIRLGSNANPKGNGTLAFNSGSILTSSSVILGQNTFTGTLTMSSGGTLKCASITVLNTSNVSVFTYGTGSIELTGVNTLPATVFTTFNNLKISNTTTLGTSITIGGTLTMANGDIITGSNIITLGTSTSVLGTLDYTTGRIIGSFCRWFNNSNVSGIVFPIGTSTSDRSFTMNRSNVDPTNGGGNLTASFITGDAGNNNTIFVEDSTNSPAYILDVYSRQGYWSIVKGTDISMVGQYDLTLETTGFTGVSDITKVRILKKTTNSGAYWVLEGLHVDGYSTKVIRSGMTTFSNFVLAGNSTDNPFDGPLPVTLKSFTSVISGRDVKLNWVTEKETNNKGFDVERVKNSESGVKSYEKIGYVESKGNVNNATNYSYDDKNLVSGRYKYRLKQIDYNGNYEYFELNGEVNVGVPKKFDLSQNYPNPFNPVTKINFDIPEDGKVSLVIYDMLGREAATLVNDVRTAGYYTVSFDASKLASGMYFYRLSAGNYSAVKKMAVIK